MLRTIHGIASTVNTVAPKPGLPKLIGSLNVAFGFMLFLIGLGRLDLIGPSFTQNQPFKLERGDAQNFYDQYWQRQLFELQTREASTKDETKKAALRDERRAPRGKPQNQQLTNILISSQSITYCSCSTGIFGRTSPRDPSSIC